MNSRTIIKIAKEIIKNKTGNVCFIDNKSDRKYNLVFIDSQGDINFEKNIKKFLLKDIK